MLNRKGLHPAQLVAVAFTAVILLGTFALWLPISAAPGKETRFIDALFTSTSAVTVTGLGTVDTETHWSSWGHFFIAILMQIGGFGIIGFASLVGYLLEGRISLKNKMTTSSETSVQVAPDIKSLLKNIAKMMIGFQLLLFVFLFVRFLVYYDYSLQDALGHGIFHAIASFNNAGFALYSDNLIGFARDGWIIAPIFITVFIASLGFPVLIEIRDRLRLKIVKLLKKEPTYWMSAQWSLNSRIVLWASFVLLLAGTFGVAILEWDNPRTLGPLDPLSKALDSIFASVMPRTAGFNAMDIAALNPSTWLGLEVLMFIGGASASTAGGIKLGTAVVLFYVIFTEIRGEAAVNIGNRRLPRSMQRQALTIVSLTTFVILGAVALLRLTTDFTLDQILFEVVSATGTVGLSTGITSAWPDHAKFLISLLMLFGRLGPIVVATSLALRRTRRHFEYPKERPLIG
ncbi:MAG: TrkH family potassium uptake protein [Rhodoluna sp.]|nr:TrkH family potassium uptake protein [Rhodoluna sp.]MBP6186881.1 TrkH family potassium uptake protein [Rhodoluna sp.]